jgi:hypothetical protein
MHMGGHSSAALQEALAAVGLGGQAALRGSGESATVGLLRRATIRSLVFALGNRSAPGIAGALAAKSRGKPDSSDNSGLSDRGPGCPGARPVSIQ